MLTSLLHFKDDTKGVVASSLKKIYIEHWGADGSKFTQEDTNPIIDIILEQATLICRRECNPVKIENKIVLSIAIRILAEQYMESRIADKVAVRSIVSNQTRELRNLVHFGDSEEEQKRKEVIERVLIITSENIHLNSFMYEPIVDVSLSELVRLYSDVKDL